MNPSVAASIAGLFANERDSDCVVLFTVEECQQEKAQGDAQQAGDARFPDADFPLLARPHPADPGAGKNGCSNDAGHGSRKARNERAVGVPLPAHTLVLRLASDLFRAQMERWQKGRASGGGTKGRGKSSGRLELRMPLNSEDDEPAARAALRFAYTGQVEPASSMREVLQLRRQAGLLGIAGDPATACDELLAAKLRGCGSGGSIGNTPPVLEFFAAADLFPDAEHDPTSANFSSVVLVPARLFLTIHFCDTLTTLNTPSLLQQLQQLPAVALEALLASDDFGTDTEDSVLLLLATWMKPNFRRTDADTRQRLAKLVRLVQLSSSYLMTVLLALATDYVLGKDSAAPAAWLPVCTSEAAFIAALASANQLRSLEGAPAGSEVKQLAGVGGSVWDMNAPRYSFTPRPHRVPHKAMRFSWSISRSSLEQALAGLAPDAALSLYSTFEGGASGIMARGFEWRSCINFKHGATAAGCFLSLRLPEPYTVDGSKTTSAVGVASVDASLVVHRWMGGKRQDAHTYMYTAAGEHHVKLGGGWGRPSVLPLCNGEVADDPLAAWADYLDPDGRITGTLTLLPSSRP